MFYRVNMVSRSTDSLYSWAVLGGVAIIQFTTIGFLYGAIGILTGEYNKEFKVDVSLSSWVGSVVILALMCCGKFNQ